MSCYPLPEGGFACGPLPLYTEPLPEGFEEHLRELVEWACGVKLEDLADDPPTTMTEWSMRYPDSPLRFIPIADLANLTYQQLEAKYPHLLKR